MPHMGCDLSAKTISGLLGTKFDSPNYAIYTGYNLTPCLVLFFFVIPNDHCKFLFIARPLERHFQGHHALFRGSGISDKVQRKWRLKAENYNGICSS